MKSLSDIVDDIHRNGSTRATKDQITKIVKATFKSVTNTLIGGDEVRINEFGTFSTAARPERQGRNPATGEPTTIKASTTVKFKASKTLKDMVA